MFQNRMSDAKVDVTSGLPTYEEGLSMEEPKYKQSWREGHHTVILIDGNP